MPPTRLQSIIEYTTLAASTTKEIATLAGVPFLGSVSSLALAILKTVETIRSNKEQYLHLVDQIHTVLCAIITIYSACARAGGFTPGLLRDSGAFVETLEKIYSFLKSQHAIGKIKQLFKQSDTASRLESCKIELEQSVQKFQIQAGIRTTSEISHVLRDAKHRHEELTALIAVHPELTNSSSGTRTTISCSSQSCTSLALLPAPLQIFHGRDSELRHVVDMLMDDTPARIAILGPGGMGKTALATVALHHPSIITKYTERYFISCHAAATCEDLISVLGDHLGVRQGPQLARRIARLLQDAPPTLLVLDNFETAWEAGEARLDVEEFLAMVTAVAHVALVITMRGAERPAKIKWTRPFLLPLSPLEDAAALQTFIDIADDVHEEKLVAEVLRLTSNLPLAVNLVANIVSHEGCEKTLARWNVEKTRLLSDGCDKGSSLEISLTLSLTSSRMIPEAQELLSLLSILPDGLTQADFLQSKLPIPGILACKSTLLKTSLAYLDNNKRLRVLAPIREYISGVYPPSPALKAPLRHHYHEILAVWSLWQETSRDRNTAVRLMDNFNNFHAVLSDALSSGCEDFRQTLNSALTLDQIAESMNRVGQALIGSFDPYLPDWGEDPVYGRYLRWQVGSVNPGQNPQVETEITRGHEYFENASPEAKGNWYVALGRYYSGQKNGAGMPWFRRAVSAASACKTPPLFLATALSDMAEVMNDNGEHAVGRVCAQEARKHAENLGSLFRESQALKVEAGCCRSLGHLEHAKDLLTKAQELLLACGVYGSLAHSQVENHLAEVFLLKTEYAEARRLNASSAETAEGRNFGLFARLTIVLIDVHTGGDAVSIRTEIERCWALFKGAGGLWIGKMMCDAVLADLHLREGHVREAKANLLGTYFVASRGNCAMIEIFCLERLADIRVALDEVESTMQWAVIFLACAMNKGNRLAGTQALRCLGAIFSVQQDYDTALSLFEVARAGFVCMGVHRSQADCLRGMAEVYENRREFAKARDLWVEARPLYERCLQTKEVKRIDEKVWDIHSALIAPSRRTIVNSQIS